ncbi:hypothetical protein [Nocardia wallacei]|uniref:hypothetical protein n=1 Tax=Nocardia wallacei TaxID=480035 RepID=UPI0024586571|nr:hypothetical protein [Nocardia wallacei]
MTGTGPREPWDTGIPVAPDVLPADGSDRPAPPIAEPAAPPPPRLGAADSHRGAAEAAAGHHDYDTALRERYRAVVRGLEQSGVLEVGGGAPPPGAGGGGGGRGRFG